ncbi:MAG TPA: haloacid dehalogenase type II [Elusimicrobia bacterium]|nr:haloacid dehalogenase type II [Elusimicrobiota bacterium]
MTEPLPYDLITFDCFGTLIDWESGIRAVVEKLAAAHKVQADAGALVERYIRIELAVEQSGYKSYRAVQALSLRLLFEELGVRLSSREADSLSAALPRWKPFPECARVLKALKRAGYRLAVLSNADTAPLKKSLSRLGVAFDHLVPAQQVRSYKPRTRHWKKVLSQARVQKSRALHVASSMIHDIIPAKTLGLPCAWVCRNGGKALSGTRPNHVLCDLSPLLTLLVPPRKRRGVSGSHRR